jgi:hypothetical protein
MTVTNGLLSFAIDLAHRRELWVTAGSFNINLVKHINRTRDE